jgi:hypothetical protein
MNSSETRILFGDNYQYKVLNDIFTDNELDKYKNSILNKFNEIIWDDDKYSEWVIRNYLGIKMILSSSVMLSSCEYSINNIRVVEPYLYYYSILNCCRCYLFTNPNMEWKNGDLICLSHEKIINCISNYISIANKDIAKNLENDIRFLKYYRELFSYRFPANGLKSVNNNLSIYDVIEKCRLISEICQFNSSLLHKSFIKNNIDKTFLFKDEYMNKGYIYEDKNEKIIDIEDRYRIDYIKRKHNKLYSLYHTMAEGLIEDFYGAWYSDNEGYNPDENWRIIFDVP